MASIAGDQTSGIGEFVDPVEAQNVQAAPVPFSHPPFGAESPSMAGLMAGMMRSTEEYAQTGGQGARVEQNVTIAAYENPNHDAQTGDGVVSFVGYPSEDGVGGNRVPEENPAGQGSGNVSMDVHDVEVYGKLSNDPAQLVQPPLGQPEAGIGKVPSTANGFGYPEEIQRYLNCAPDEDNMLSNILDMNAINRIGGGLGLDAGAFEDDPGILGGSDPGDNF
jgi:hypothetical protein